VHFAGVTTKLFELSAKVSSLETERSEMKSVNAQLTQNSNSLCDEHGA
jgi:hypothetical protein